MTSLIVNADDFGLCPAVNRGVVQAHVEGIVTSASLMVRCAHAADAIMAARRHPGLALGLHIDIAEWVKGAQGWVPRYQVVSADDPAALEAEVQSQVERFRWLAGRNPNHLDSHQHVHREEPLASIVAAMGRSLGVPVRDMSGAVSYRGDFYGQTGDGRPYPEGITVDAMLRLLGDLGEGVTEVGCHPAASPDVDSVYRVERTMELATLCDPAVRGAVEALGIRLVTFAELTRGGS